MIAKDTMIVPGYLIRILKFKDGIKRSPIVDIYDKDSDIMESEYIPQHHELIKLFGLKKEEIMDTFFKHQPDITNKEIIDILELDSKDIEFINKMGLGEEA